MRWKSSRARSLNSTTLIHNDKTQLGSNIVRASYECIDIPFVSQYFGRNHGVKTFKVNQQDLLIDIGCIGRYQFGRNCVFEKCSRRIKYSYNVILQEVYRKFKFPICELYLVYGDLKAAFSFCSLFLI